MDEGGGVKSRAERKKNFFYPPPSIFTPPESVFLDEGSRAGVRVNFCVEFLTNEKAPVTNPLFSLVEIYEKIR